MSVAGQAELWSLQRGYRVGVNGGRLVGQSDWSAVRIPVYLPAPSFYDQRGIVRAGGGGGG